jgi:hypothetical protein
VRNGYAIVVVNDRGTQWSEGSYQWLRGANQDGSDILDWIIRQPWSNGKVGTFGCSSSGESQPPLATINHPAHKAMVEMAGATAAGSIPGYRDQGIFYHGGVPDLAWTWWYHRFGLKERPLMPAGAGQDMRVRIASSFSPEPDYGNGDFLSLASHLPAADILRASGVPTTEWDRLIQLAPASPEWKQYDFIRDGDKTSVPGLHIDSWYDVIEAYPTVKMFQYLSGNSPNQHLVMGPTAHCKMSTETSQTSVGDRTVGDGRFDYVTLVTRWFDRWLKDDASAPEPPAVQYYVLNSNEWRTADAWPPRGTRPMRLFLSSGGHANGASGDGRLLALKSAAGASSDRRSHASRAIAGRQLLFRSGGARPVRDRSTARRSGVQQRCLRADDPHRRRCDGRSLRQLVRTRYRCDGEARRRRCARPRVQPERHCTAPALS